MKKNYRLKEPFSFHVMTGWAMPFTGFGGYLKLEADELIEADLEEAKERDVLGLYCIPVNYDKHSETVKDFIKKDYSENWWKDNEDLYNGYYLYIDVADLERVSELSNE